MRSLCLIVNPSAGGGRAARLLPRVETALRGHGLSFHIERTNGLEHARTLARGAVAAGEMAVATGGDGLVAAVAGELHSTEGVLGVLPGGRGNDFARKLGIPADPVAACETLAHGAPRSIDVAMIGSSVYLGIASAGLDSEVQAIANATRLRLGSLVYLYAVLRALRAWRPARWEVRLDGAPRTFTGYSVAVCNTGVFGGGMRLAPRASVDDGQLDVVLTEASPKGRFLLNLPRVFRGTHVNAPTLQILTAREVTFGADRPFVVYADGDPIADLPATVQVLPGALRVMAPAS